MQAVYIWSSAVYNNSESQVRDKQCEGINSPVWHWGHVCAGKPSPAGDVRPASAQPQSATSADGDPYNDNLQEWILFTKYGNK